MILHSKMGVWFVDRELLERIRHNIEHKINTLVVGGEGLGKTTLLKHLELANLGVYMNSPLKSMLLALAEPYGLKGKTNYELREAVLGLEEMVLLVDDYDRKGSREKQALLDFKRKGFTIIAASKRRHEEFIEVLELEGIPKSERMKFMTYFTADTKLAKRISKVTGNPEKMIDYASAGKVKTSLKLPSLNQIVGVAFLLLSMKYIFYSMREYQVGYVFATIAYLIISTKRIKRG